jgi:hypothetical protein
MLPEQISRNDPAYIRRVSQLAYKYWENRGKPDGCSEEDWYRAEREIEQQWEPNGPLRFDKEGNEAFKLFRTFKTEYIQLKGTT